MFSGFCGRISDLLIRPFLTDSCLEGGPAPSVEWSRDPAMPRDHISRDATSRDPWS